MALFGLLPDAPTAPDPAQTAKQQLKYGTQAAQKQININSIDRTNPFGSSTFDRNAKGNVTGMQNSLAGPLAGAADSGSSAVASQMGLLPTNGINWDETTAPAIAQKNMDSYYALTMPGRQQQQNELNVRMGERGLPVGSEISDNQWGNLNREFANADVNAAAQAWNAVPGMQGQLINNQTSMYDQPAQSTAQSLGLLQGLNQLTPQAQQAQGSIAAPNYAQLAQNQYQSQLDAYNNSMSGLGSLANVGLGLLTAPMTGGTSLLGMGAGSLFNTPGATTSGWDPSVFYS